MYDYQGSNRRGVTGPRDGGDLYKKRHTFGGRKRRRRRRFRKFWQFFEKMADNAIKNNFGEILES